MMFSKNIFDIARKKAGGNPKMARWISPVYLVMENFTIPTIHCAVSGAPSLWLRLL